MAKSDSGDSVKQATLQDVCAAVGVSTASVSRALNNKPGVGPELKQRILAAVKQLNYVPRAAARNLSRARSDTLGIVFQDLTEGWLLTVFRGIMSRASGRYHVLTSLSTSEGDEFELPRRMLAERRVDGLIWFDMRATPGIIREMSKEPEPLVLIQRQLNIPGVSTVSIEGRLGAYEAMHHLLAIGYRRIVLVAGQEENEDSVQKLSGVRLALKEFSADIPPENILNGHHVASHAIRAFSSYLDSGRRLPEAVFAFNDDMAIALMHWLQRRGVRVPEDVAIVGFDGISDAEANGLTTVETPMYEMGALAAQLLIDQIEDPAAERQSRHVVLKGVLKVRESCGSRLRAPVKAGS